MIYRNLSITAGGGIIAHSTQADQEESANIFIGLGGTGISCLKEVKAQVYNRLKPDDETSDVPEYRHIQFLAIDTDESSLGDDGTISTIDKVTEFENIGSADIHAIINNTKTLRQNPGMKWFSENISIQNAEAGAGGVRQIGRLLVIQNVDRIVTAITNKINLARTDLADKRPINIHIFTGMGGGTGSGTFLDICYILKHILEQLSIAGQAQTSGYFFLPDVNLARVNTETVRKYIEINGFAAMKELDYCMNFHNNRGEWNQNYGSFTVKSKEQPVKLAYLITAKDENGGIKSNGYDYAMNVVTDYVMEFMTKELVSDDNRKNGDFGLRSHIANFRNVVTMVNKRRGACHDYCVLGAANAFMPYKDINTYLAARIFEDFDKLPRSNHDIDNFVADNGLKYEDILNQVRKDARTIPFYEVDPRLLKEQCQGITVDVIPQVLGQMRDALPAIEGTLAKNREALRQTLIEGVYQKLLQYCTTFDKGPFYASLMLLANNKNDRDFGNVIAGYIEQNDSNLANARGDLELRNNSVAAALREVQNRRPNSRRAQQYVAAVNSYYSQLAKIAFYREMGDLLNELKPQVTKLYNERFAPMIEMLNNVAETFRANLIALSESTTEDKDYAVKIIDLDNEELKETLDLSVSQLDTAGIITGFIEYMLTPEHMKIWLGRSNDAKLANVVSEYFVRRLESVSSKNIDEYLAIKFKIDSPELLSKAVYSNIMLDLKNRAKPLFWADKSEGGISEDSKIGYISIPDTSDIISSAANKLHMDDAKVTVRKSIMPDRISVLLFYCGIPMYLFKGTYNYKPKYLKRPLNGMHLYEGTTLDPRNYKKLHDIIPLSIISDDEITDMVRQFEEAYKKAVSNGIISKESSDQEGKSFNYYLRIVDEESIHTLVERIDKVINEGNPERLRKLYESINTSSFEYTDSILLPQIGTNGYEDSSVEDVVFASEVLKQLLFDQLSILDKKLSKIQELESKIGGDNQWRENVNSFATALCTGVIYLANRYTVKYLKDEDGFTDEYELTTIDTVPFGEHLPLFSAFVQYVNLDKEDKEYIDRLSKDRKLNDEDTCVEYTNKIKDYIDKKYELIKEIADNSFRAERKGIYKFIETLKKLVDTFAKTLI